MCNADDEAFLQLGIDPPARGYKRQWVQCRRCGKVFYQDYIPYSLANPVIWLPCGHSTGRSWSEATENITAHEAFMEIWNQQRDAA